MIELKFPLIKYPKRYIVDNIKTKYKTYLLSIIFDKLELFIIFVIFITIYYITKKKLINFNINNLNYIL